MRARLAFLTLVLVLSAVGQAAAQYGMMPYQERRSFNYLGRNLTIEIAPGSGGELHVVRAGSGRIEVTGRAVDGFVAAGLAEYAGDKLRLVAVAAKRVEYMVLVPEDVRVRVRLPDRYLTETARGRDGVASFEWGDVQPRSAFAPPVEMMPVEAETGPAPHRLYMNAQTPRVLSLPDRRTIRKITIRYAEGDYFEVSGSRALQMRSGNAAALEVRPSGEPMELIVRVPRSAPSFELRVGDQVAFAIANGQATALCAPVVEQKLDGGRQWFTFTPSDRQLACGAGRGRVPGTQKTRDPRTVALGVSGLD
jgi:hypothetical protein